MIRLFLNRALLVADGTGSSESLDEVLAHRESKLGESRLQGQGYAARPIDIDILAIGDRVIEHAELDDPASTHAATPLRACAPWRISARMAYIRDRGRTVSGTLGQLCAY